MRTVTIFLTTLLFLVRVAYGGEVRLANLSGADFAPGKLRLPLTVTERGGVERKAAVVTGGVPFPPGFLYDVNRLAVIDTDGKPVISQATVMVKWHKPVYDGSVQWALISFVADSPANGAATYYLVDDGRAAVPDSPLRLARDGQAITVNTGKAEFVVPLAGPALIASASIGGRPVIGGQGLRAVIVAGDWPDRELAAGSRHVATHADDGVTVEESGPARVVIAIKGQYSPGDADGKLYRSTTRLYIEARSAAVRVIHTIGNTVIDPTLTDGWRRLYTWPIKDASLVADLTLGESARATTLAEGKPVSAAALTIYQDSSGGDKWKNLGGGNYERWLSRYTNGQTVRGVSFRGYRVAENDNELAAGDAHLGVLDVSGSGAGVTAALRNFRVEYPSALHGSGESLRVGLFPGEFAEPFHLNAGQRKSWDVRLTLHGDTTPSLEDCYNVQDVLLLFRPEPAWMVRAGAAGAWPTGLALLDASPRPVLPRMNKSGLDGINAGWDWYGWISSYNSGGAHWNQSSVFAPWALFGDGATFDQAEARALWAELTALHFEDPDIPALWLWLMGWNDREPRIRREFYPGHYNRDTWGLPDSGHMGMFMWPEYYLLTGDMRAREALEHLGNRARAMLWRYNYDDRNDGTGPMPRAVQWCKKRDPDTDPSFMLATRYVGWPLYNLAQYYRFTGETHLLDECRTVARAFRNTARYSPIGLMVLQINDKGSKAVYGGQGPFDPYRDQSASQCYAHFQQGIMATGLAEYYLMSRDIEAVDTMIGFGDLMSHHVMIHDPQGNRRGWTYAFGDYWGPYTWADANDGKGVGFMASNFRVVQPMGWIYRFTGREDFRETLVDALASQRGPNTGVIAAHMAVAHPKVDQTAPAAVTDLRAETLGGGKVRLTWTVPDDNGASRPDRYQVKHAAARIVERIEGWPDRTPPLPENKAEWEAKAAAFHANQRAFWAAENAAVVPAADSRAQGVVIGNLSPGRRRFAVKAWSAADNIGRMSNLAEATVK